MAWITPQIDAYQFLNMQGAVQLPQQQRTVFSRIGVDGESQKLEGNKPVQSVVVTEETVDPESSIDTRMENYKELIDNAYVSVIDKHGTIHSRVTILDVENVSSFTANPGGSILRVRWTMRNQ